MLALASSAGVAEAARVNMTPTIQGAGALSASTTFGSYACVNGNLTNNAVQSCGLGVVQSAPFTDADMVVTASVNRPGGWFFAGWTGCPTPVGNVCLIHAEGHVILPFDIVDQTVSVTPRAIFRDLTPPAVSLSHTFLAQDRTVRFNFPANEPASFRCRIDTGAFQTCTTGKTYTLNEGTRTFRLEAIDPAGNDVVMTRAVRVLETVLVSGPKDFERVKSAAFRIRSGVGTDFDCRLDGPAPGAPAFTDCGEKGADGTLRIPFNASQLAQEGQYTFQARARDGADIDETPLSRTWIVDTIAPETTLNPLLGPPQDSIVTALSAEFGFSSNEAGTIQCRLDGAPFAACTSPKPFSNLPFGDRKFDVRAVDRAGNADTTPASRSWTIQARDNDGDGFNQRTDCDDANAGVNPGRPEVLENGVDENCDGADGVNLDRDGDGVQRPADCNDGNPGIRPGANDVPNNDIDEDCQGGDLRQAIRNEQVERIVVTLSHTFSAFKKFTTLSVMQVKAVPLGSKVTVTCKVGKKKCPGKARKKFTKKNAFGTISLKKYTKRRLKVGTTITVTVTKPNAIGAVKIFKVRKGKKPKVTDRCLPPGVRKPVPC